MNYTKIITQDGTELNLDIEILKVFHVLARVYNVTLPEVIAVMIGDDITLA